MTRQEAAEAAIQVIKQLTHGEVSIDMILEIQQVIRNYEKIRKETK